MEITTLEKKLASKDVETILSLVYWALLKRKTGAQLNIHDKNGYLAQVSGEIEILKRLTNEKNYFLTIF